MNQNEIIENEQAPKVLECNCTPRSYSDERKVADELRCSCKPYNEFEETVPMMLSDDYKARFVAEYRQTKIRYERLKKFCNRIEAALTHQKVEMPKHDCDLELLRCQQRHMGEYLHCLEIRAVVEHIEL